MNTTVYETNGINANEVICIVNGVGRAKIKSTRAGRKYLTMEEASGGSLNGISPTSLNPHMDGKGTLSTTRDFYVSPGAPQFFLFTDKKKAQFDFIDPQGGDVTVSTDTPGERVTVDRAAYFYMYAVDNGGNICTQLDSNDRFTATAGSVDAYIDTADPTYGDFIDGEAVFIISREKSFATLGLLTVSLNLQGADSGVIGTNKLLINFDHGKTIGFEWITPASDTSIDSIANVTLKAIDQFNNYNDNYAGEATFTALPNVVLTGDINNDNQPYEPTTAGDPSDTDPSDKNFDPDNGGLIRQFVDGVLSLEVMSLRAVGYTMSVSNAEITGDSNGIPVDSNTTFNFKSGSALHYEIFDPTLSGYSHFDSTMSSININISQHDQTSDLTTDYWGKIGVQALDRGGNLVSQYNLNSAFTIEAFDTSDNKITEKIDFVIEGGQPYAGNSENVERTLGFAGDPITYIEMRAKLNITYELRLKGMPTGVSERNPSTGPGDKYITFKNGSLSQFAFVGATPANIQADQTFTVEVEGQDQYGNRAEDYDGFIELGIDDTTTAGVIKIPSDVDFPSDAAIFPPVSGYPNGTIQIIAGSGSLAGFEYQRTNATSNRTITLYVKETDVDFDQSGSLGLTDDSHEIVVQAGTAQNIVFNGEPVDALVDTNAQFKLRVEDIHGNLCYNIPETNLKVRLNGQKYGYEYKKLGGYQGVSTDVDGDGDPFTSDGNDIVITNGSETFVVWSQKSESVDITLFDSPLSLPPTNSFEFYADSPTELIFVDSDMETPINGGSVEAGQDYTVYVAARDQFENIAKSYQGTAELRQAQHQGQYIVTSPTTGVDNPILAEFQFINGNSSMVVVTETMTKNSVPDNFLELSFGNFTGSATITDKSAKHQVVVDHFDGVDFSVTPAVLSETIDNAVEFTAQAIDAFGNPVDDYVSKSILITSTDDKCLCIGYS